VLSRLAEIEASHEIAPDAVRRLAAIGARIEDDAARLRERLRLSNDEFRRLASMVDRWWSINPEGGEALAREVLYRIGADDYFDRMLIAFAHSGASSADEAWGALLSLPQRWTPPKFPLAAKDFIARGIEKGPALGAALAKAEDAWIAAGFPEDQAAVAKIADSAIR
jgi:poly(A) polymerase